MRHPTRIRQLHGFFDAEQLDTQQNAFNAATAARMQGSLPPFPPPAAKPA